MFWSSYFCLWDDDIFVCAFLVTCVVNLLFWDFSKCLCSQILRGWVVLFGILIWFCFPILFFVLVPFRNVWSVSRVLIASRTRTFFIFLLPGSPKGCFMNVFRYLNPSKRHSFGGAGIGCAICGKLRGPNSEDLNAKKVVPWQPRTKTLVVGERFFA